ncbi:MAG: glycosyltransferase family 4 protein [Candidatus Omnitrophica bacterium]|nr:glycosyltransferase family 4 protein [Candidatus Omnitrophota bacterium]
MNILFLTNHLNVGGVTSYCFTLASGFVKKGHQVLVASSGGKLINQFRDCGVEYIHIPMKTKSELSPKIILSSLKLTKIIRDRQIDIVHSNSRTTQVLGCLLERRTRVTHVSTCHGFFKPRFSRKLFGCWGKRVIAISEQVKDHLVHDLKVNPKKIKIIHNGIDIKRFQSKLVNSSFEIKKGLGLKNAPVVGIIARLSDVKGHSYLIEAMKLVVERFPETQLLVAGEGKTKNELLAQVEKLGLKQNVYFIDEVSDTNVVLSIMDIFVMPSINEGLGLALMEAMAKGLPVIGSNVGGIKTLLQNGANGVLFEPKDTSALAEAIIDLLKDKGKREKLGLKAQSFISQNFSQEKMISETEKAYLECLAK